MFLLITEMSLKLKEVLLVEEEVLDSHNQFHHETVILIMDKILAMLEMAEDMMKKMEGLSSQVINGHFSISDRFSFNSEIEKLTNEINRLNGDNMVVTKNNCMQLSQRISDLTRNISAAAVYRNSARTVFMVNSRQPVKPTDSMLDITL